MNICYNNFFNGVEINGNDEHFVIITNQPMYVCSWYDCMKLYKNSKIKLPSINQLQIIYENIDSINQIIKNNNGFEIYGRIWSYESNFDFLGCCVNMNASINSFDSVPKNYQHNYCLGIYNLKKQN